MNIKLEEYILIKPEPPAARYYRFLPYPDNLASKILGKQTATTEDQAKGLEYALSQMPAEDQNFLLRHFKEAVTLDQLAAERGVSKARISQIINRVLDKLREFPLGPYIEQGFTVYDPYYKKACQNLSDLASLPEGAASDRRKELIAAVRELDIGFLNLPHHAALKLKRYAECFTIEDLIEICSKTGGLYSKYGWNAHTRWLGEKSREVIDKTMRKYRLLD